MSKQLVPEWMRKLRELESLVKGAWVDIIRHEDWLGKLDKRLERLERKSKTKVDFHPKQDKKKWPEC